MERAPVVRSRRGASPRGAETAWLLTVTAVVIGGLFLVYRAKTREFPEAQQALAAGRILNLNALTGREQLLPFLTLFPNAAERQLAARAIYNASGSADFGKTENVGRLARLHLGALEVRRARGAVNFQKRLAASREDSIPLFTREQFRAIKQSFVVRLPAEWVRALLLWSAVFLAGFWGVHGWWLARRFSGDTAMLPAMLLLAGVGLILMVSLRDPLRDTLMFAEFAQGAAAGCVLLAAASALDYRRFGRYSFVPLAASFVLSVLLIVFGYGPGTSDAKVNLFGFQPVEVIRLLLVLFLAGYFARRWEALRGARETRPALARFHMPPVEYTLPVFVSVALSLVFFFLQRDLGPALVFVCLFLGMYAIARNAGLLAAGGLAVMLAGFLTGYALGFPRTVAQRVEMWLSPWNNTVRGGDQLAHSLWSMSTGGVAGTGVGLGEPSLVPAAHTDLVLSAIGE